ncbi:unnamed protein product [Amoebophrya sp. A120]|nr:unnamed protein product [Amoebophrya sp. A120]|eukprot:GSA120T00009329001.1
MNQKDDDDESAAAQMNEEATGAGEVPRSLKRSPPSAPATSPGRTTQEEEPSKNVLSSSRNYNRYKISWLGMCRLGWGFPQTSEVRLNLLPVAMYSFYRKDLLVAYSSSSTLAAPGLNHKNAVSRTKSFIDKYAVFAESMLSCPSDYVKPLANTIQAWEEVLEAKAEPATSVVAEVDERLKNKNKAAIKKPGTDVPVVSKFLIQKRQDWYLTQMKNTTFMLIPRGDGRWTHRFYLALAVGAVPVVIADGFSYAYEGFLPKGLWESVVVKIPERAFRNPYSTMVLEKEILRKISRAEFERKKWERSTTIPGTVDDHGEQVGATTSSAQEPPLINDGRPSPASTTVVQHRGLAPVAQPLLDLLEHTQNASRKAELWGKVAENLKQYYDSRFDLAKSGGIRDDAATVLHKQHIVLNSGLASKDGLLAPAHEEQEPASFSFFNDTNTIAGRQRARRFLQDFVERKTLRRLFQMPEDEIEKRKKLGAYLYDHFFRSPEQRLFALLATVRQVIEADLGAELVGFLDGD